MARRGGVPSYRCKRNRGRDYGVVTLTCAATSLRRDFYLGDFGSPESRTAYRELLDDWEARGRVLDPARETGPPGIGMTVGELTLAYYRARKPLVTPGDARSIQAASRVLNELFCDQDAASIGPVALEQVREAMIAGNDQADPPRRPWSRVYINRAVRIIVAMYRWAAAKELLPAGLYQALMAVDPLRAGRTAAPEMSPVGCAPQAAIDAVLSLANDPIAAMIKLQLATAMRPGEVCSMRPCDLDLSNTVWIYTPASHKTQHLGRRRAIPLGPKAKRILKPFLRGCGPGTPLFSPARAESQRLKQRHEARTTPMSCGNVPGSNRVETPRRAPRDRYTPESYCKAIRRLCDKANARAVAAVVDAGGETPEVRLVARWHPNQLRHNAATECRRVFGLEAAATWLGHSSGEITDRVYAERDQAVIRRIARRIG